MKAIQRKSGSALGMLAVAALWVAVSTATMAQRGPGGGAPAGAGGGAGAPGAGAPGAGAPGAGGGRGGFGGGGRGMGGGMGAMFGGGPQLDPAKAKAAQETEAKFVAKDLKLDAAATGKLVTAYQTNRDTLAKEQTAARDKLMAGFQGGGAGGGDMSAMMADAQKMMDMPAAQKTKFETEIKGFLSAEQATKASTAFAGFGAGAQWDNLVNVLADLKVEGDKQDKALGLIQAYAGESAKAQANMMGMMAGGGGGANPMADLKTKLDTDMAGVLSAEQLTAWKEKTAPPAGRGGMGGRGGAMRGGAPGGGVAPAAGGAGAGAGAGAGRAPGAPPQQ